MTKQQSWEILKTAISDKWWEQTSNWNGEKRPRKEKSEILNIAMFSRSFA